MRLAYRTAMTELQTQPERDIVKALRHLRDKRPTYRELDVSHRRDYRAARRRLAEAELEKPASVEPNTAAPGSPWSIDQHGCLTRRVGG